MNRTNVRVASIVFGTVVGVLLLAMVVFELSATTLATRAARDVVERCAEVDAIEVTSMERPAALGLVRGEVRDVRVTASGIQAGELRIDQVAARLPVVPLWGAAPESTSIVAEASLSEADLQAYLAATSPDLASPTLRIGPDGLQIGDERVPFTLELLVRLSGPDIQLVPTLGDPRLWSSLGLELDLEVPDALELTALRLEEGRIVLAGRVEVLAGLDRQPNCPDVSLLGAPAFGGGGRDGTSP